MESVFVLLLYLVGPGGFLAFGEFWHSALGGFYLGFWWVLHFEFLHLSVDFGLRLLLPNPLQPFPLP